MGLPLSPLASLLGFTSLPLIYWVLMPGLMIAYLSIVEIVKRWLFDRGPAGPSASRLALAGMRPTAR